MSDTPYLSFNEAAKFVRRSRARVEQLIRDPRANFPRPYQPQGPGTRRCFKADELSAWLERRRASYSRAGAVPAATQ